MMRSSLRRVALAATLTAVSFAAKAADLDYGRMPADRYSEAYEDPRYRDLYAPEPPRRAYDSYDRRHPVPPGYVYRDNPANRYGSANCLPREAVRERLVSDGWRDFQGFDMRGDTARINARRPNGDLYALNVDRCSGDIVGSRIIERAGAGPYAYEDGPRRSTY